MPTSKVIISFHIPLTLTSSNIWRVCVRGHRPQSHLDKWAAVVTHEATKPCVCIMLRSQNDLGLSFLTYEIESIDLSTGLELKQVFGNFLTTVSYTTVTLTTLYDKLTNLTLLRTRG